MSQEDHGGFQNTERSAEPSLSAHIEQNIESVVALQRREWERTSPSQRRVERFSRFIGRPAFLWSIMCLVVVWLVANLAAPLFGAEPIDPPPFALLEGALSFVAFIVTTIVLIAQNRQSKLEQQHTHLGLQVNLLTEQKVTKLIHLIEELRRDLPMVKDRHDAHAEALQKSADTAEMLSAIAQTGLGEITEREEQRGAEDQQRDP